MSLDISLMAVRPTEIYERNITHNLAPMAKAAGIYFCIWRPGEANIQTAADLIKPLRSGLAVLREDPQAFKVYEPSNGWGSYGRSGRVRGLLPCCV